MRKKRKRFKTDKYVSFELVCSCVKTQKTIIKDVFSKRDIRKEEKLNLPTDVCECGLPVFDFDVDNPFYKKVELIKESMVSVIVEFAKAKSITKEESLKSLWLILKKIIFEEIMSDLSWVSMSHSEKREIKKQLVYSLKNILAA